MRNCGSLDGVRLASRKTIEWMTSDHLGKLPAYNDLLIPGYGFGLGFAVRLHSGLAPQPGSPGQYFWSGIGGTSFFVDPAEDVFALLLTQAPNQRIFFRNLYRHLVYTAID
jgi:CubicO group peptidase (beta-lactamase class C family)